MPRQFVDVVVAQVVGEAHHAELGVRRIQYPAVHHPAGTRRRRVQAGGGGASASMQRAEPASGGHDVKGRDEPHFIHMNLPIISPGSG